MDYLFGFIVAGLLSGLASLVFLLISFIGFFGLIIAMFAAPTAGVIISEGARWATRRHRSRALFITIIVAVILGSLPVILLNLTNFMGLIFQGAYLALTIPTIFYRLSGIQLFR
jgi:archaellum biogenesis protein FlaJ (TadC family)